MKRNNQSSYRILLVEDEESLAVGLEYNLHEEGYEVTLAADGEESLERFSSGQFDLVILDIMLPHLDGFQVAKKMREQNPRIPILMLTARGDIKDRLKGLEIGADDYMTKPFHLDELLLRTRGMLRRAEWYRAETQKKPLYTLGKYSVNFENLECISEKHQFQLTPQEAMLLKYLVEHKDRVLSRQELLREVWQIDSEVETRTVDTFIARLRKYFEEDPKHPRYITSIRSAGYMFREKE